MTTGLIAVAKGVAVTAAFALAMPLTIVRQNAQPTPPAPIPNGFTAVGDAARARATKHTTDQFDDTFRKYTKRYFGVGFDWTMFKAQGMAESGLTPTARSAVGARGVMQLMPSTFAQIQSARPEFESIDDPERNIAAGIMHDRYLWKLYENDLTDDERMRFMFASYNAGEGTINRARAVADASRLDRTHWSSVEQVAPQVVHWRYQETLGYVRKIEANLTTFRPKR